MSDLDKAFEQLKRDGKNNVENIIKWLKDAKVVNEKYSEDQAKKLFGEAEKKKVELEKFKEVVNKISTEQKMNLEQAHKQLLNESGKFIDALKAGLKAFENSLKENSKK